MQILILKRALILQHPYFLHHSKSGRKKIKLKRKIIQFLVTTGKKKIKALCKKKGITVVLGQEKKTAVSIQ